MKLKLNNSTGLKQSFLIKTEFHIDEDIVLLLSRKLGVIVKSTIRTPSSVKNDAKRLIKYHRIQGLLSI